MRSPSLPGFRLDVGEACARWRIGNADEMVTGRTLNLAPGELRFAFQRLVAVGTAEFKFIRAHKLHPDHVQTGREMHSKMFFMLFIRRTGI